jgi:Flp pilus assembly protein TadD
VARAIDRAQRATTLAPLDSDSWVALGAAFCRAGKWGDAVTALQRCQQLQQGGDCFAWYFLAMAHWHLGAKAQARQLFDRAAAWQTANNPHDEELQRLRSEVQKLLSGDAAENAGQKSGRASENKENAQR